MTVSVPYVSISAVKYFLFTCCRVSCQRQLQVSSSWTQAEYRQPYCQTGPQGHGHQWFLNNQSCTHPLLDIVLLEQSSATGLFYHHRKLNLQMIAIVCNNSTTANNVKMCSTINFSTLITESQLATFSHWWNITIRNWISPVIFKVRHFYPFIVNIL